MIGWPPSLIREIAERRVIFFIGAGLSKTAHADFPTWSELLTDLSLLLPTVRDRKLVGQLIRNQRMLDAAQVISDSSPRADLTAALREKFQIRPTPHHEVYQNLLLIDPKAIVTTNYDEFLEKNFEHYSGGHATHSVEKPSSKQLIDNLRSPVRTIVKMHGCITEPAELVLDRSSFFNVKRFNQGLYHAISALMTVNTVLFIGYSISDPDIQLILENINIFSVANHPHYALMQKFEHPSIKKAISQTYNIEFVEYASGSHHLVPDYLDELKTSVSAVRGARGII